MTLFIVVSAVTLAPVIAVLAYTTRRPILVLLGVGAIFALVILVVEAFVQSNSG